MAMVTCVHCATVLVRARNGFLEVTCHCFVVLCVIHHALLHRHCSSGSSYIAAYKGNALLLGYWIVLGSPSGLLLGAEWFSEQEHCMDS